MKATALKAVLPEEGHHRDLISCQAACPVHTDARGYVKAISRGRFREAYLIARGPNPFASICGRICGAPCEAACRRGRLPRRDDDGTYIGDDSPVAIRALKRFVCERFGPEAGPAEGTLAAAQGFVPAECGGPEEMAALLKGLAAGRFEPGSGERVAVIGAGPAGLSAAHDLALLGFSPVVFESESEPAGMLAYGVPAYRLPRAVIRSEVEVIVALGVEVRCGVTVGREVSLADLRRDFQAVVVAAGAKRSHGLGVPGESGPGVFGGVDLLREAARGRALPLGSRVVVVGGGNVAYDVARTVLRQISYDTARTAARMPGSCEVHLVSLETLEEMPADTVEIREGEEEGIIRRNGWGPVQVLRDGRGAVRGVEFRRCLRVYDHSRRFRPEYDDSDRVVIEADTVLLSVGQTPDLSFLGPESGVEFVRPGWPRVDPDTLATTAAGLFVAGDLAHGARLLIDAVASGKKAARSVYRFLTGRSLTSELSELHLPLARRFNEAAPETVARVSVPVAPAGLRLSDPALVVESGYSEEDARREAGRCLDCGVSPVFDGARCVLCGGCVDVCPTVCLKLVSLSRLELAEEVRPRLEAAFSGLGGLSANSAILKDEDRCLRCGLCEQRCPADAITMERVCFNSVWRQS